jgi:manganese transport protein
VILSLQLSFAVIPLVYFTGQRSKMGEFVNRRPTAILAWMVAILIFGLNTWLVFGVLREWLA